MLHDRHWTIEEANEALEDLAPRIRELRDHLESLRTPEAAARLAEVAAVPGGGYPGKDLAASTVRLALGLHDLSDDEIVVRDLERGLIDFPSLLGGEEIYLCWLLDEPAVGHWHAPESGFGGRQPL